MGLSAAFPASGENTVLVDVDIVVVVIVGAENSVPSISLRCDKLLNASGEMATISTPCGVSRVESTMASPPTCWRTSLSASVVLAAMNFWGPIYHSALSGAGLRA